MSTERKEMDLLVERHIDRVSAAIERDKEALVFGGPTNHPCSPGCACHAERAADAILALINTSPRTPTREAIAAVVAENMPAVTINGHPTEEQMKREDAAYLRGRRDEAQAMRTSGKITVLEAEIIREQVMKDMREVTGIRGLGGWKAQ